MLSVWLNYFTVLISAGNGRGGESIYGGYFEGNGKLSNKQSINVYLNTHDP